VTASEPDPTTPPEHPSEPLAAPSGLGGPARLSMVGVSARYRDRIALDDVGLQVGAGQRVGIIGPNGAGKSTLLKCIVGLVRPTHGRIEVEGRPAARARGRVAYLPQRAQIDWEHPAQVRDVVAMGRYPHRGPVGRLRREYHEAVEAALVRVGLGDLARVRIAELSGGQQQRTFLARAFAQQATSLLLDEPYAGLDAATTGIIDRELTRAAAAGAAVVVVNHDLAGLHTRSERLVVLNRRVITEGAPADVLRPEVLDAAYGRGAVVLADPAGPS
jgi:ABC-type Mn2+/Zn2+ transport system ATPase subunit